VERLSFFIRDLVHSLTYYNQNAKVSACTKYSPVWLRHEISVDAEAVLLAKIEDEIVGFCLSNRDDALIWLSWIGVHETFRRLGIATLLLKALDQRAKNVGSHKIWGDCRTANEASMRLLNHPHEASSVD
jgi:GNAT superfamily N-acetyltransferase